MKLWARPVLYGATIRASLLSTAAAGQDSGGKHPQGGVEGPIDGRIESAVLTTTAWWWLGTISTGLSRPWFAKTIRGYRTRCARSGIVECLALVARFIGHSDYMLGL